MAKGRGRKCQRPITTLVAASDRHRQSVRPGNPGHRHHRRISRPENAWASKLLFRQSSKSLAKTCKSGSRKALLHLALESRRDDKGHETLHWYANLVGRARRIACISFAFNLDDFFRDALLKEDGVLRYALFDKNPGKEFEDEVYRDQEYGNGAWCDILKKGDFELFLGEKLTGFNRNLYIHDKFILINSLGEDPIVVTGTANFSKPSQYANDENMLVIRGNTRVADIYFGEFMRISIIFTRVT